MAWLEACAAEAIDEEDAKRFDYGTRTFAIYRSPDDAYYATDGLCTHEKIHLVDGPVVDHTIECPKHNGRFDHRTGHDAVHCRHRSKHTAKATDCVSAG